MVATSALDLDTTKARQQRTWSSGNYAAIGTTLQITGESLCEALDVAAGERVLDVAAGNGNASLAAARRGCDVTATDYVGALLQRTRARAAAEELSIDVREADAESLPFSDATFDVVVSTFGVMFTPDQERVAAELLRVCRPRGRIGLANWTPDSFVGQMFKIVGRYAPAPAGLRSPLEWGTRKRLTELFGAGARTVEVRPREFVFRYSSAEAWLDAFRSFYGPTHVVFESLDADGRRALARDLIALAEAHNSSITGAVRIPSAYVEVVCVKK
jgi:ubiquinone/menaquinone biosynthesis C-methylase UbiE